MKLETPNHDNPMINFLKLLRYITLKRLGLILLFILLLPNFAFASNNPVEIAILITLHLIVIIPYYLFALIPFYIQSKYNGKSEFFSLITYSLCIAGIILAYYQEFRFVIPNNLNGDDIDFF